MCGQGRVMLFEHARKQAVGLVCTTTASDLSAHTFLVYSAVYVMDSASRYNTKLNVLYLVDYTT